MLHHLKKYFYKYLLLATVGILFAFLIFPIYIVKYKIDENFVLGKSIVIDLAKKSKNKKELVNNITHFVAENFDTPDTLLPERNLKTMLKDKKGYCDEQANVFLALCNYANIKGRLVFLYGTDSISHHSVAEIQLENWYMIDPFLEISYNKSYLLPSISIIKQDQKLITSFHFGNSALSIDKYSNLFHYNYPEKIVNYNTISYSKTELFYQNYITFWMKLFGKGGIKLLEKIKM